VKSRKGFTLIELMVVILIVGILVAAAIPIIRGRIDAARWSEGKTGLGTIAIALRTYAAEKGAAGTYGSGLPTLAALGLTAGNLRGTHFTSANYSVQTSAFTAGADPELTYTISATNTGTGITAPTAVTLNQAGVWAEKSAVTGPAVVPVVGPVVGPVVVPVVVPVR
jgi:prepilin-type N-terminal cleavage/methylation domain-containing protein